MTTGLATTVIPLDVQGAIVHFWQSGITGQIALNFKDGRILSSDTRRHDKTTVRFCSDCGRPINHDDGQKWRVTGGRVVCGYCR